MGRGSGEETKEWAKRRNQEDVEIGGSIGTHEGMCSGSQMQRAMEMISNLWRTDVEINVGEIGAVRGVLHGGAERRLAKGARIADVVLEHPVGALLENHAAR